MAKKKRYKRKEVQQMLYNKFGNGNYFIQEDRMNGARYRIGLQWVNNLTEIVNFYELD